MEIATQPDSYTPIVNDEGNYIDSMPSHTVFSYGGVVCSCGSRKDKVYLTRNQFASHTKSKTHQEWLKKLSNSNLNYYTRNQELEQTVNSQKQMLVSLHNELKNREITILTLTRKIAELLNKEESIINKMIPTENLLDL